MKVKTCVPEEERRGFVYEVPCKDCRKTYVGETKRTGQGTNIKSTGKQ